MLMDGIECRSYSSPVNGTTSRHQARFAYKGGGIKARPVLVTSQPATAADGPQPAHAQKGVPANKKLSAASSLHTRAQKGAARQGGPCASCSSSSLRPAHSHSAIRQPHTAEGARWTPHPLQVGSDMKPVQCSGPSKGKGLRSYSHSASNATSLIPHDLNTMKREREMLRITQRHATSVCTLYRYPHL